LSPHPYIPIYQVTDAPSMLLSHSRPVVDLKEQEGHCQFEATPKWSVSSYRWSPHPYTINFSLIDTLLVAVSNTLGVRSTQKDEKGAVISRPSYLDIFDDFGLSAHLLRLRGSLKYCVVSKYEINSRLYKKGSLFHPPRENGSERLVSRYG
jgi:hypothetical protein